MTDTPIDWKKLTACFSEMQEIMDNPKLSNRQRYQKTIKLLTAHELLLYELRRHQVSIHYEDDLDFLIESVPAQKRAPMWMLGMISLAYIGVMAFTLRLNVWVLLFLAAILICYVLVKLLSMYGETKSKLPLLKDAVRRLYYLSENNFLNPKLTGNQHGTDPTGG